MLGCVERQPGRVTRVVVLVVSAAHAADPATRATESSESNTRGTPHGKCMIMFLMCPPNLEAGRAGGRSDDPLLLRLTRQQPFARVRILKTRIAPSIGRNGVSKNVPCCASLGFWSSQQTHWSIDNKRRQVRREREAREVVPAGGASIRPADPGNQEAQSPAA